MPLPFIQGQSLQTEFFAEAIFSTPLQKKIVALALVALGCLAILFFYLWRTKWSSDKVTPTPIPEHSPTLPVVEKISLASTAADKPLEPSAPLPEVPLKGVDPKEEKIESLPVVITSEAERKAKSLLQATSQPIVCNTSEYGGDDTLSHPTYIEQNAEARLKLVDVLGGQEACEKIPVIECPQLSTYFDCFNQGNHFPKGHAIVQGEDQAGRKFVLMRIQEKLTKEIVIYRVFQRRRETCVIPIFRDQDGFGWFGIIKSQQLSGIGIIAPVISILVKGTDPDYELVPY